MIRSNLLGRQNQADGHSVVVFHTLDYLGATTALKVAVLERVNDSRQTAMSVQLEGCVLNSAQNTLWTFGSIDALDALEADVRESCQLQFSFLQRLTSSWHCLEGLDNLWVVSHTPTISTEPVT